MKPAVTSHPSVEDSFPSATVADCGWVSLTFDDALDQHLDHVVPVLNEATLRGTFYAHLSASAFVQRRDEWRRASANGHELGNHTVFHPADERKEWVRPGNAIDGYSLDRMRVELQFANDVLEGLDGRCERTFAYPCSNSYIGRRGWVRRAVRAAGWERTRLAGWMDRWNLDWGSTRQTYEPLIAQMFLAGRGGGLSAGQDVPPTSTWRKSQLPSVAVMDWSLPDLQNHVMRAVEAKTWLILQFHGVGGGHHMDCSLPVFREFVLWLKTNYSDRVVTVVDGVHRLWPDAEPPAKPNVARNNLPLASVAGALVESA